MIRVGDWVTFNRLPDYVSKLPAESQAVFKYCVGRTYRVDEITEDGDLVLDVSADIDKKFGGFMNDIRVELEYVELSVKPKAK